MTVDTQPNWGRAGIFWSGVAGEPVARLDDMSDYGRDEPMLPGDMEAALIVANVSEFHWLVVTPQGREPWEVLPFDDEAHAITAARETDGFYFDGRTQTPEPHPSGVGFTGIKNLEV